MKTSCAHLALLASVLTTCTGGFALAFVSPATPLPHGGSEPHHALGSTTQRSAAARASFSSVARRPFATRDGLRLAAREDCKSCMEQDLMAAEAAAGRGVEKDDGERRRALFEEVRFSGTPQVAAAAVRSVTQNQACFRSTAATFGSLVLIDPLCGVCVRVFTVVRAGEA